MNYSMTAFPVLHCLQVLAQTHVSWEIIQGVFGALAHVINSDVGKTGYKHPMKEN